MSKYIPEFGQPGVLASGQRQSQDPNGGLVPAKREITIKDLLNHTSGLAYHWDSRIASFYRDAGICMAQIHPDGQAVLKKRFSTLAYQAIVD